MWEELTLTPQQALEVVLSTVGMYLALVVLVRMLGQRVLARVASSDLATIVALGAVIGRAALGYTPTLGAGLLALLSLFGMQAVTGHLKRWRVAERFLLNRPVLLMSGGTIIHQNLHKVHLTEADLWPTLRLAGVRNLDEVACVVLETTGEISVLRLGVDLDPRILADVPWTDSQPIPKGPQKRARGTEHAGPSATMVARAYHGGVHHLFSVHHRHVSARVRRGYYIAAGALVLTGAAFFALTLWGVLHSDGLSALDQPVRQWLLSHRSDVLTAAMRPVARVFGPVAMPIIVLVVAVAWTFAERHAWRPLLFVGAMVAVVIISQIILPMVHRSRPPVDAMLLEPDPSFSFPSGHVLGACDFLLVLAYLVTSRRQDKRLAGALWSVAAVLGIGLVTLSRLYLGYHWLTDAFASMFLSLAIIGAVIALDTWRTVRVAGEARSSPGSAAGTDSESSPGRRRHEPIRLFHRS
ncbi:phosphatase PAP2 family protein [Arthrobacter sp. DNA4]|uniref:phosphatase PAP2 family protein n=1 Tax=Arthrobacter sp. DNA4 TaxID=2963432 RepID=UPI0020CDFAE8|nr:phosphatase PAP2 family protein [Arthrobacter sp. DNA4]UTT68766.1 phosphatase PAP2 family protein [Arthrobacter sp. DNA4]